MGGFYFSKLVRRTALTGQPVCCVPTNLANWTGGDTLVGNLSATNINESEVGFYFTRVNPWPGSYPALDPAGYADISNQQRYDLIDRLEAMKVIFVPGSSALLGLTTDWLPFTDLNYVTVVPTSTDTELNAYVQLAEQRLPATVIP